MKSHCGALGLVFLVSLTLGGTIPTPNPASDESETKTETNTAVGEPSAKGRSAEIHVGAAALSIEKAEESKQADRAKKSALATFCVEIQQPPVIEVVKPCEYREPPPCPTLPAPTPGRPAQIDQQVQPEPQIIPEFVQPQVYVASACRAASSCCTCDPCIEPHYHYQYPQRVYPYPAIQAAPSPSYQAVGVSVAQSNYPLSYPAGVNVINGRRPQRVSSIGSGAPGQANGIPQLQTVFDKSQYPGVYQNPYPRVASIGNEPIDLSGLPAPLPTSTPLPQRRTVDYLERNPVDQDSSRIVEQPNLNVVIPGEPSGLSPEVRNALYARQGASLQQQPSNYVSANDHQSSQPQTIQYPSLPQLPYDQNNPRPAPRYGYERYSYSRSSNDQQAGNNQRPSSPQNVPENYLNQQAANGPRSSSGHNEQHQQYQQVSGQNEQGANNQQPISPNREGRQHRQSAQEHSGTHQHMSSKDQNSSGGMGMQQQQDRQSSGMSPRQMFDRMKGDAARNGRIPRPSEDVPCKDDVQINVLVPTGVKRSVSHGHVDESSGNTKFRGNSRRGELAKREAKKSPIVGKDA